jgi:SIR2-like domain
MIDPLVSLAFALHSNKGAYALLLGSGVSRAAAIPTGWEVVLDLVRKVAKLQNEDPEPDPVAWFLSKHGTAVEYSKLLDLVAKTSAERQQLLRSYFEPTEEERSQKLKSPTVGHRAIAELASKGYVRVILTTNFDRLLETAMEEIGITPTVISTADQISGALPLVHSGVTIIKLHGDYLDTRIKNTTKELERYTPKLTSLLDRILDEYGLIVCGWSADWDVALREAVERCPSRRFTTYWTTRNPLTDHAKRLAEHRRAEIIQIADADRFFTSLVEKVQSLDESSASHPLSAKVATATVKRYLVDPAAKIKLYDLVQEETQRVVNELGETNFPLGSPQPSLLEGCARARKYEALLETLLAIVITGCFWGEDETQLALWPKAIERTANLPRPQGTFVPDHEKMRAYPALLLMYGGGIAALANQKYAQLAALLQQPVIVDFSERRPVIAEFSGRSVNTATDANTGKPSGVRLNFYLRQFFRARFSQLLPEEHEFRDVFDRFEYLFGLVGFHLSQGMTFWAGEYLYRYGGTPPRKILETELTESGANHPYLKAHLFESSLDKLKEVQAGLLERQKQIPRF